MDNKRFHELFVGFGLFLDVRAFLQSQHLEAGVVVFTSPSGRCNAKETKKINTMIPKNKTLFRFRRLKSLSLYFYLPY